MNLLQMSFSGSVMILAITVIRAFTLNKLPKKTFLILWGIVLLRLILPYSIPSPVSIYSLIPKNTLVWEPALEPAAFPFSSPDDEQIQTVIADDGTILETQQPMSVDFAASHINEQPLSLWTIIWITGFFLWAVFFSISYLKCIKNFRISFPIHNETVQNWIAAHQLKRSVSIRASGFIHTPLTYGIVHPVILMPKTTDYNDTKTLPYILEHEFVHIKRLDAVTKLLLTVTLCIHWFNPFVYLMYVLANRDIELSCDETVIQKLGKDTRSAYARALIRMEEKQNGLTPLYNGFSKNAIEERITAIMKTRKRSIFTILIAIILVAGVILGFATSNAAVSKKEYLKTIPSDDFTQEESDKLFALWFDDYESMTITTFRKKTLSLIDTAEYRNLIERFSNLEIAYSTKDIKEADALNEFFDYFYYVFEPLTAEKWQTRDFADCVYSASAASSLSDDTAVLEYTLSLQILNPDKLTTEEYNQTRIQVHDYLKNFLEEKTSQELIDEQFMRKTIQTEISHLKEHLESESLALSIDYFYVPLSGDLMLRKEIDAEIDASWDEILSPYAQFGLTWNYANEDIKMYYQGKEVKGIYDAEKETWITSHTGNSTFEPEAVELHAVYENGSLTGLRQATKAESEEWQRIRISNQNSDED